MSPAEYTVVALADPRLMSCRVKVVKQQINGGERVVLKENAMAQDLKAEAMRLKTQFGYDVQHDKRRGTYIISHDFYQGKFALTLEPNNQALVARVKEAEMLREKNLPTIPVTLEKEKKTNPFLRPDSAEIRKSLAMENADSVSVFAEMRARKDAF